MSTIYWNQWDHAEIMSMHGVEAEEDDIDLCHDECDTNSCQDEEEPISMRSLGLSWKDFM